MSRRRTISLATALTAAVAGLAASAPSASAQNPSQIMSFLGDQCLQPVNGSTAQGAAIVQEPCDGGRAQLWTRVPVGGNAVHYVNALSGLCLDARGRAVNGTPVQQWTCNKISNEKWDPGEDTDDTIPPLTSLVSGTHSHCLDQPGGRQTPGLAVQIYLCNGTLAQVWFTP